MYTLHIHCSNYTRRKQMYRTKRWGGKIVKNGTMRTNKQRCDSHRRKFECTAGEISAHHVNAEDTINRK